VMAAGYAFGAVMVREEHDRRRLCLRIGLTATALYLVYAGVFVTVNRGGQTEMPVVFAALNPSKYPASPAFLLMTLGPTIALMPFAERARGAIGSFFETFGRVPLFYYLLHIPAIHVAALIVALVREGRMHPEWYATAPYAQVPRDHRWGLPLLYLVFAIVVALLYVPCRWYAHLKARRRAAWMRFL